MTLDDLPRTRITSLFPLPVEGRDVSAVLAEKPDALSGLGLKDSSHEDWSVDVPEEFPSGHRDLILQVWSETSGKRWFLVYSDGKPTLFGVPIKKANYEPGDRVYDLKGDTTAPYYLGNVESLCPRPFFAASEEAADEDRSAVVKWDKEPGARVTKIKDIALANIFTPMRWPRG